jgi:tRNA pseudouridine55 synthase
MMKDGLLLIDKHEGCTSHDIVAAARRVLRIKKIGHCGTLDPSATGLLLLTIGRATRLTRFLIRAPKVYEGRLKFGITTDTYDISGEITSEKPTDHLQFKAIESAMEAFHGSYFQTPPPYCAKKINGKKYYELARRGEEVPQDKKEITVYEYHPAEPWPGHGEMPFLLGCSSGTYARSLVHELGGQLGCGATLSQLRRTRIGSFKLDDALDLEELRRRTEAGEELATAFIPFDDILLPFGEIVADPQQERRVMHGQTVLVRDLEGREGDWIKVLNRRRQFIAVGSIVERIGAGHVGVIQPKVVFQP